MINQQFRTEWEPDNLWITFDKTVIACSQGAARAEDSPESHYGGVVVRVVQLQRGLKAQPQTSPCTKVMTWKLEMGTMLTLLACLTMSCKAAGPSGYSVESLTGSFRR